MNILNITLLFLCAFITTQIPSYYFDNEIIYLNLIGLGYLFFYIFFISKNSLFDLSATAFLLFFGLLFDSIFSNHHFYHYGLVDYPSFKSPPAWSAVLWLILPLQYYKLNLKFKFFVAGFLHTILILLLQTQDLMFIQRPFKYNLIFVFVIWLVVYRFLFRSLDLLKERILKNKI